MSKARVKQFVLSEPYQLGLVDRWWAGLLYDGLRELISVEWEALGEMRWRLKVHWKNVSSERMNVGHPLYADIPSGIIEEVLHDDLNEFESVTHDYEILKAKAAEWGLESRSEPDGQSRVYFSDKLDEAERILALEYLWPTLQELEKNLAYLVTKMTELDREMKARDLPDYYAVMIDRSMLRDSFTEQIGYENEWLFVEVGGAEPLSEE